MTALAPLTPLLAMSDAGVVLLAALGGALSLSTPYLLVSLGECLTERSGRVNLGLEGTLILGAVAAYATAYATGSPWLGVLAAGLSGLPLGLLHGALCSLPRVNHIAVGFALMVFGVGLAIYLGKPLIQPQAPTLPVLELGAWSAEPAVRSALRVNVLFLLAVALAPALWLWLRHGRGGLTLRTLGESEPAARALGFAVVRTRILATMAGGFLAGLGGAYLSLYNPGVWNEGLSQGQGLMAVALVIFARWSPLGCLAASLLFGAAVAVGPALQSVGVSRGHQLFAGLPALLTLLILVAASSPKRELAGAPGELSLD